MLLVLTHQGGRPQEKIGVQLQWQEKSLSGMHIVAMLKCKEQIKFFQQKKNEELLRKIKERTEP